MTAGRVTAHVNHATMTDRGVLPHANEAHPRGVSSIRSKVSKEATAFGAAAVLVVGSLLLGQQAATPNGAPTPVLVRDNGANTVVAVNSKSAMSAEAAWNATSLRTLPGSVLVLPPVSADACAGTEVVAARAAPAIADIAQCAANDPNAEGSSLETMAAAVAASKGRIGSLVLLGGGWTQVSPVAIDPAKMGSPIEVALAIEGAKEAGEIPDMTGIDVVLAGPPPAPEVRRVWDQYLAAAGAASVEWAVSRASATPQATNAPSE